MSDEWESMELLSRRLSARDEDEARRLAVAQGWTDGLPIVVPTPDRVRDMLATDGRPGDHVLARIPEQGVSVLLEQVAVNAVMAGCSPRDMPILVAVVAAIGEEPFNLHATTVSGATAPLTVVSGDAVVVHNINAGFSLFGPGPTADGAIGRAVRLVLLNACGGTPGVSDKSTFGHPGKFSYCIGESTEHLPDGWAPLHRARGLDAPSGITVASCDAPIQVRNDWSDDIKYVLAAVADVMSGHTTGGTYVVVLGPRHARVVEAAGLSREDVARELHDRSARSVEELVERGRIPATTSDGMLHAVRSPDDIVLVVAGGHLYGYSAVLPPWVGGHESRPVTARLRDQNTLAEMTT